MGILVSLFLDDDGVFVDFKVVWWDFEIFATVYYFVTLLVLEVVVGELSGLLNFNKIIFNQTQN